jgi:hypothetical protein
LEILKEQKEKLESQNKILGKRKNLENERLKEERKNYKENIAKIRE